MDRFWTILLWVILLAALIGILRYGGAANQLLRTFFGWLFGTTQVLAGLAPSGTSVPNYPNYPNAQSQY